jgi:cell division protein FtsQ
MNSALPAPLDVRLMNMVASALFLACAVLVLAAAARWLARSDAFAIEHITVRGDLEHNNALTLRANVSHKLDGNFFTINLGQVRQVFEAVPWVRQASVRREFPNRLDVVLQEHRPVAYWGPESGSAMLDRQAEVFEANVDDVDPQEAMPRLAGPAGTSAEVLAMYRLLQPIFALLDMTVEELTLSARGGWHAELDTGASIELGGGSAEEVRMRAERFVRTLTQVTAQYGRRAQALESADLRHTDGYAIRLRGVTTTADAAPVAKK